VHYKLTSEGAVTDFHYSTVVLTEDGEEFKLETIWNLNYIPGLVQAEVDKFFGGKSEKYDKVPDPTTPFGIFHANSPTTGPQDVICAGVYENEHSLYAAASERIMGWNREAKGGRRPWFTKFAMTFPIGPEAVRNVKGHAYLRQVSKERGAEYSNDTHDQDSNCANNQVRALFPDNTELHCLPLHELVFKLPSKAREIYVTDDRNARTDDFIKKKSNFVRCIVDDYLEDLCNTLMQPTLRQEFDGNPPCGTTYFVNHLRPENPHFVELLRRARKIHLEALQMKAASLAA
jgi:hypothetical protein